MSTVRKNLNAARNEYEEAAYPGDLASEVMPRFAWRRFLLVSSGLGAGSLAAAAAIVVGLMRFAPPPDQKDGSVVRQVADRHIPPVPLPTWPELPASVTTVLRPYERYVPDSLRHLDLPFLSDKPADQKVEKPAAA